MYSLTFKTKTELLDKVFSVCFLKCDVVSMPENNVEIEINSFLTDDDEAKKEVLMSLLEICDLIGSNNIKLVMI